MKNFRKVLALVLVVATLFSFTAMAGAVNIGEYEDWKDVSYDEAVDVLSAVGILNGYDDVAKDETVFKPTGKIERDEMAKMIAVMANAGTDVSELYASACTFADVAKDNWAASYIAYCAKTGIVAGRSATTFDPDSNITGLETAKMLLVVLSFDPQEQGYVGADWKINVLRDAKAMGLLNGFKAGYDIEKTITREEAAQMMLNALQTNVVIGHLTKNSTIAVTNKLLSNWADLKDQDWTLIDAKGIATLYGNVVISKTPLYQALFNGKLEKAATQRDCFGRPATVWTWTDKYGNETVLADTAATPAWESLTATPASIAAAVKKYENLKLPVVYYWDGAEQTGTNHLDGGKGAYVALYVEAAQLTVVEINTYLGYVGHPNTANGKVEIVGAKDYTIANTNGFTVADEGTAVMYWLCCPDGNKWQDRTIHSVEVVEPTKVTLHGNTLQAGYFCDSNEKKYEYNVTCADRVGENDKPDVGEEAYIYTDKNGYVLGLDAVGVESTVSVMVGKSAKRSNPVDTNYGPTTYTYIAKFVEFAGDADGYSKVSDATAVTKATYDEDKAANTTSGDYVHDVLVRWVDDGYGKRDVTAVATPYTGPETPVLKEGKGTLTNVGLAGNKNTKYILRLYNADNGAYVYKYFEGSDKIDATYKLDNLQYFDAYANDADKSGRYTSYVYADASAKYAPVNAFVLSFYSEQKYWTGGDEVAYYLYDAVVNGEQAYIAYNKAEIDAAASTANPLGWLLSAINDTNHNVYKAVKASYVKVIVDTHDEKPIYIAQDVVVDSTGKEFVIEGDVLTYKDNSGAVHPADMAEDATIVIAADYKDTNPATDEVIVLTDYSKMINYLENHGWETAYSWVNKNGAGEVTDLYLYVKEK